MSSKENSSNTVKVVYYVSLKKIIFFSQDNSRINQYAPLVLIIIHRSNVFCFELIFVFGIFTLCFLFICVD